MSGNNDLPREKSGGPFWQPKPAAWWKRLPVVRHARWAYHTYQVNRHYEMWAMMGMVPSNAGRDYDVLDAIWRGDL
jgi:hypothetical protein